MKKALLLALLAIGTTASAQSEYTITVDSKKPSGIIDEMLYGQLFEHIYFSANNGVWQELIQERSFEPEQYPGIAPRDGYFDGWYMDDDQVLHSPTRYEQPLRIDSIVTSDFDLTMDVNWRAPATLRIKGDWTDVKGTEFEYYAPGSLTVANSMENKQAVALKRATATTDGPDVLLDVPALSAGVLTIRIN